MQRFLELRLEDGTVFNQSRPIEKWLYSSPYHWLLACEVDDVRLEVKNGILHWKSGVMYWGVWHWGVFESGEFRSGVWNGGIWLGGTFKGKWMNGVFKAGSFEGEKIAGDVPE